MKIEACRSLARILRRLDLQRPGRLAADPAEIVDHGFDPDVVAAHLVVAADVPQDVVGQESAHRVVIAGVVDIDRATDHRDVPMLVHRSSMRGRASTVPGDAGSAQGREDYRKRRMSDETSLIDPRPSDRPTLRERADEPDLRPRCCSPCRPAPARPVPPARGSHRAARGIDRGSPGTLRSPITSERASARASYGPRTSSAAHDPGDLPKPLGRIRRSVWRSARARMPS